MFDVSGMDTQHRQVLRVALLAYDRADYGVALPLFQQLAIRVPSVHPRIAYYMRVCQRVLSTPLFPHELRIDAWIRRHKTWPRFLSRFLPYRLGPRRCKWCGRYTRATPPDRLTCGFMLDENSCLECGTMYHMPSWKWDSPDGRAYSYSRGSFDQGSRFYEEYERDLKSGLANTDASEHVT